MEGADGACGGDGGGDLGLGREVGGDGGEQVEAEDCLLAGLGEEGSDGSVEPVGGEVGGGTGEGLEEGLPDDLLGKVACGTFG